MKIISILIFILINYSDCDHLCGDWIQYKDIKCIFILENKGTEEEAVNHCTQLDKSSTLLTIHSKEEQDYLNNLLINYSNISFNAWIGLKYVNKTYKWLDGTNTDFSNWFEDAVKDGSNPCVEMSLIRQTIGRWSTVPCAKPGLFVCQKKQAQQITLNDLKNALENITKDFETKIAKHEKLITEQQNEINTLRDSSLPIGFLYTQLPKQLSPQQLWPHLKWTEVTKDYSGLFFRAEGGESLPFGQTQQANQSWISDVHFWGNWFDSWKGWHGQETAISLNKNEWVMMDPGHSRVVGALRFYSTGGEVRPKNTAIKIWKRIQ